MTSSRDLLESLTEPQIAAMSREEAQVAYGELNILQSRARVIMEHLRRKIWA